MDVDGYLARIGLRRAPEPTADGLTRLHRAHLLAVPFENLDIPLGLPIVLSLPALYDKIVRSRRGGFCYELNGIFGWLLEQLGFPVARLSARVFHEGMAGPDFDHMLLLVGLDPARIADVGFGDSFLEPLSLHGGEQVQQGSSYRLIDGDTTTVLERRRPGQEWEPQYVFSREPRRLEEFDAMCLYQQTSPESVFRRKSICSLATPDGRITLSNGRWIVTSGARRDEREVRTEGQYRDLLRTRFGIRLDEAARVDRLLVPTVPSP